MFKKLSVVAALLAVAGIAMSGLAPTASAAEPTTNAVVRGLGTLDATGNGLVAVYGTAAYHATAGEGVLLVKDDDHNAIVHVEGYRGSFNWNGWTVYFGFTGTANVFGSRVGIVLVGRELHVDAIGRGIAFMKGNGTYSVNGGPRLPWTEQGSFAAVLPPP